jgi:glucokinase
MSQRGGIDLGGTKIQAVVVVTTTASSARRATRRRPSAGPQDVADAMVRALREAADAAGVEPGALAGIGVGSPGTSTAARAP